MIAPVSLSVDALLDGCERTGGRLTEMHRQLALLLLAHGQLVFADATGEEIFWSRIGELGKISPVAGKCWEELLTWGRFAHADPPAPAPVEKIFELPELLGGWDGVVDATVMEPERAQLLGCPPDAVSWIPPDSELEIACHDCATASETLAGLQRLDRCRTIRKGSDRERFWEERLAPLVRAADQLVIQDKYLGENLQSRYQYREEGGRAAELQETEWLLRRIAETSSGLTVSIFTSCRNKLELPSMTRAFKWAAQTYARRKGAIERLQVFLIPMSDWKEPHDRHLRADKSGVELSAGFDRLRTRKLTKGFTATYLYAKDVEKLIAEENGLRAILGKAPLQLL
ncbi:MAG: hypothetical protein WBC33_11455 [Conexibacter sp.]